jgi:hypothetical protein
MDPHLGIQPSGTTFVASFASQRERDIGSGRVESNAMRLITTRSVFETVLGPAQFTHY